MLKFKLEKLVATSLVALVMGSSSIMGSGSIGPAQRSRLPLGANQANPSAQDQATLPIPNYRFEAAKTYAALKAKADAGDEIAQKVLENYNGSAISTDLSAAKNAAAAYNNKDVTPPTAGGSINPTRTAPLTTPLPRTRLPIQGMEPTPGRTRTITPSSDNNAEVEVPKNGLQAARLYSTLNERKNDKVAEEILKKYKRSDFQNFTVAAEIANEYNRAIKEAGEKAPATEKPTEAVPSEVPALKAELAQAEAQIPKSMESTVEKIEATAEQCILDVAKYETEIKALKDELKATKHCSTDGAKASKGKEEFETEMEELIQKISTATDKKELDLLNYKIGQLETQALKAGIIMGEAAEKKAGDEEAKKLKEQQHQARQALKKVEEEKDIKAYDTKGTWLATLSTPKALADYLNRADNDLFGNFTNATQNLRIVGLIESEGNENVLRALRHMVRKFQGNGNLTQKQKDELSVLMNKIELRLGSMGVKTQSQEAQGSSFTASPEDKRSYETFQFVWTEAKKDPTSKLFKSINNIKNTDQLITLITSSPNNLSGITFDAAKLRTISFSKATLLELKAFKYVLSQVRTTSFNPTAARNLTQTIDETISTLQQGSVPQNLVERTNDEQKIASRIKVTPAQRNAMMAEQNQADKAKINQLMPKESAEVKEYIFDQMVKNAVKVGELTTDQLKEKIEQFKEAFERSKGEDVLFTMVSGILPTMTEKDRRDVLKKLLNLNFDFRTANTPEGQAKIIAEGKKIADLNERRRATAAKTATKTAGPALSPGDSILVRRHLKALYPEKSAQEINTLFNKVATDMMTKGLTGAAITEEEVKAGAQ